MEAATFKENIWFAIAEPSRRKLIDILLGEGEVSASKLARLVPYSRQAVSKNLVVLQKASLIHSRRVGKEVRFAINPEGISVASQELSRAAKLWDKRLQKIKQIAEAINEGEHNE